MPAFQILIQIAEQLTFTFDLVAAWKGYLNVMRDTHMQKGSLLKLLPKQMYVPIYSLHEFPSERSVLYMLTKHSFQTKIYYQIGIKNKVAEVYYSSIRFKFKSHSLNSPIKQVKKARVVLPQLELNCLVCFTSEINILSLFFILN